MARCNRPGCDEPRGDVVVQGMTMDREYCSWQCAGADLAANGRDLDAKDVLERAQEHRRVLRSWGLAAMLGPDGGF